MKGHLDPDTAAEFRAGLITGHRERAITAHLATCAECASLTERLAQVSALLAAAPVPAMPDSLARRLDEALATEVQKPFIITASVRRPRKRRMPALADVFKIRILAPAAAGLAVLAGAGYGLSLVSGSSSSGPAFSSGAAGSAAEPSRRAAAPVVGGSSSSGAKMYENGLSNGPANEASGVIEVVPSSVDYRSATLKQQVSDELAAESRQRPAPVPASAKLAACVRKIGGRSSLVLVESAHYNGEPATVIVLRQGGQTNAVVAGPTCAVLKTVVLPPGISTP